MSDENVGIYAIDLEARRLLEEIEDNLVRLGTCVWRIIK